MTDTRGLSHKAFTRAQQLIPGGVNSPARAFGAVGGEPIFSRQARGLILQISMVTRTLITSVRGGR